MKYSIMFGLFNFLCEVWYNQLRMKQVNYPIMLNEVAYASLFFRVYPLISTRLQFGMFEMDILFVSLVEIQKVNLINSLHKCVMRYHGAGALSMINLKLFFFLYIKHLIFFVFLCFFAFQTF
jgi:hypothetical protein